MSLRPPTLLLLLGLAAASPALTQSPAATDDPGAAAGQERESAPTGATPTGLRAFVDPETGEITANPTPEQVRDLEEAIRRRRLTERTAAILRQGYLPGFGNAVQLGPRMFSSALALPGEAGPVLQCSQGANPLAHAAHAHPAAEGPPPGPAPGLETRDR